MLNRFRSILGLVLALLVASSLHAARAKAGIALGSALGTAPNGAVCEFEALEPVQRVCTVGQDDLIGGHPAAGGLVAPFDGVIVRWAVLSGPALPGTGSVELALRAVSGPGYLERGGQVELPPSLPGTVVPHTFPERMPISVGQPIGLTITIANRNTQMAGAPIAFREAGIGTISVWSGEPFKSIWSTEAGAELLLNADIEPDADHDKYGDLTQDRCPTSSTNHEFFCIPGDREPPVIKARAKALRAILDSGRVAVRVRSSEAGRVNAEGRLEIRGRGGWTYALPSTHAPVANGGRATLRPRISKPPLAAARSALAEGREVLVLLTVTVTDAAGNQSRKRIRIG